MALRTWGSTDGNWQNSFNWIEGLVPDSGDDVSILSNNVTNAVNANANSLEIRNAATLITSANLNVAADLRVGGGSGQSVFSVTGGTTTANSLIIGDGFAGFNTFRGRVNVSGSGVLSATSLTVGLGGNGLLVISDGGTVSSASTINVGDGASNGFITIGGTFFAAAAGTLNANVALNTAGSTLNFNTTNAATYDRSVSSVGSIRQSGFGQTTLTENNSNSGTNSVFNGTLQIGNGGSRGSLGSGAIFLSGGLLDYNLNSAYTLSNAISGGGALQFRGGGQATINGANSHSGALTIGAGTALRVESNLGSGNTVNNGSLVLASGQSFGGVISGTGSLETLGGTVILTGANTFTGATTVTSGTLQIGNGGSTGSLGSGTVSVGSQIDFNRSGTYTVANTISGGGSLVVRGGGTAVLGADNGYSGGTSVQAGSTLQIGNGFGGGRAGTGGITNHGVLDLSQITNRFSQNISGTGIVTFGRNPLVVVDGNNSYSGTTIIDRDGVVLLLTNLGTGTIFIDGELNIGGDVQTINNRLSGSGLLRVSGFSDVTLIRDTAFVGQIKIDDGSILRVGNGGNSGFFGTGSVTNNGILSFNFGTQGFVQRFISNTIAGFGNIQFSGTAAFHAYLTGVNTYTGTTSLLNGVTLFIGNEGSTGNLGTGAVTVGGNSLLIFNRTGAAHIIANDISGTGRILASSTATTILTGTNTYSGETSINSGSTLQIGNGGTTGSLGTGDVVNNGTLEFNSGATTIVSNAISGSGNVVFRNANGLYALRNSNSYSGGTTIDTNAVVQVGSGGTVGTGNIDNSGTLIIAASNRIVTGVISGTGALRLDNTVAPSATLTNNNTYSGSTFIQEHGTLIIGNGGTTGSLGTGAVTNNGTLIFRRSNEQTIANVISGSGNVAFGGGGSVSLTGNNNYSGTTEISLITTLQVGNGGSTGSLGTGAVNNNGVLQFSRSGADYTVNNAISGSGGLFVNGPARGTFTNTLNHTGLTRISGTLALAGSASLSNSALITLDPTGVFDISGISGASTSVSNVDLRAGSRVILGGHTLNITGGAVGSGTFVGSAGTDGVVFNITVGDFVAHNFSFTNFTNGVDSITINGSSGDNMLGAASANATTINGGDGNDTIVGSSANDILRGDGGNDIILGSAGADIINGGAGVDIVDYSASSAAINIDFGAGSFSGGDAQGDALTSIEIVIGSAFADRIRGTTGNDDIRGGGGNDILAGGAGIDTINGGAGNDFASYAGSNAAVNINFATNTYSGGHADGDTLTEIESAIGSAFVDTLIGSSTSNTFEGGAGGDIIDGGDGFDTASYASSTAGVTVNLATNTYSGGDATGDTLTSIEGVIGSDLADTITGNSGDNTIEGGAGDDVLVGGAGNDTVSYAGSAFGVTVHLDNPTPQNTVQQGIDTISGFENILGSASHDMLFGDDFDNVIIAGAGFDTLTSGGGTNTLIGGDGGDLYFVQGVNDVIIEAVGGGYDIVLSQVNFTLAAGAEVEALAVNTSAGITLTGNEFQQVLTGNAGSDTLNGGGGNDLIISGAGTNTLIGGTGDDIYYTEGLNDIVTEAADGGFDVVLASGNLSLAAGSEVEFIAVNTQNGVTIIGSNSNQTIQGAGGNDRLIGGLGNDRLQGSGGNDTFVLGNTFADRDFLVDFASGADKLEISAALFGGGLTAGVLSASQFLSGAGVMAATTAAQRFIYNSSNGNLMFDSDGNGAGAAVLFASLLNVPVLTAADFLIAG